MSMALNYEPILYGHLLANVYCSSELYVSEIDGFICYLITNLLLFYRCDFIISSLCVQHQRISASPPSIPMEKTNPPKGNATKSR
jgi:hypothetical protein